MRSGVRFDGADPERNGRSRLTAMLGAAARAALRRYGTRTVFVYFSSTWLLSAAVGADTLWNLAHQQHLNRQEVTQVAALMLSSFCVAAALGVIGSYALLRPLRVLEHTNVPPTEDVTTWHAASRVPTILTSWNALVFICWSPVPLVALSTVRPGYVSAPFVAFVVWATLLAVFPVSVLVAVGASRLVRPLLRQAAQRLDSPQPPLVGPSVGFKLRIATPIVMVAVAGWAVPLGSSFVAVRPSRHVAMSALTDEMLALALVLAVAWPITRLLARSILRPLDNLLAAAVRLAQGDFATRVPETSLDEYGRVAHAFNKAMVGLAERQRLAAENERLLEEVTASRARIVVASDMERKRIERNIHDGAQQGLLAALLDLNALEHAAPHSPRDELAKLARDTRAYLTNALDELRELAQGLHPSVLESDGLFPALEQLASRSNLPVNLDVASRRLPPEFEAAAYFIAAEALANVDKHARARAVDVSIASDDTTLRVSVIDDGRGGARARPGSGLAGLADRVAALGGTLAVCSPPRKGTVVTATFNLAAQERPATDLAQPAGQW